MSTRTSGVLLALASMLLGGCNRPPTPVPEGALLVVQSPLTGRGGPAPATLLDARYPDGSRLIYVSDVANPNRAIPLSRGLAAAGAPALNPDGRTVAFAGKSAASNLWQIYLTTLDGGEPRPISSMPQGAADPAWLGSQRILFSSPDPKWTGSSAAATPDTPALYSLAVTGGPPTRLTHGRVPATDGTVLPDGRILFVSSVPNTNGPALGGATQSLFTINNDGTEISAFGLQHDGPAAIRRPRQLPDGRVVFLSAGAGTAALVGRVEQILSSRPFRSRSVVFPQMAESFRSVECDRDGLLLVTLRAANSETFAVHRLSPGAASPSTPWFDDPAWNEIEAVPADLPPRTAGRLSSIDPAKQTGILLCLDARLTDRPATTTSADRPLPTLRVTAHPSGGSPQILGETSLAADGSFLIEVPADLTLGFDLLDSAKRVVRQCPPTVWTRPGENRSCIGCHEPHSTAPENLRPLAVKKGPVTLPAPIVRLTQQPASP